MASYLQRATNTVLKYFKASKEDEEPDPFIVEKRKTTPQHYLPIGSIGTPINSGTYEIEKIISIRGQEWYPIADAMVRSDANIRKNIKGIIDPIKTATYQVESASDTPQDQKIKEFIEYVVFELWKDPMTNSGFDQFIFESCYCLLTDGNAPFETIFKYYGADPIWGNFIGIKDISYRDPRTFEKYHLEKDGSIDYIEQLDTGDLTPSRSTIEIPGWTLMVLVNEKIGADWEGLSVLRSCYGAWQIKQDFLRATQKLGHRSLGVPVITIPSGIDANDNSDEQIEVAKQIVMQFTDLKGRINGLVKPKGYEIDQFKIDGDKDANVRILQYLDGEIDKAFGATFSSKDLIAGGSRSAREDASRDFYRAIESYPRNVLDVFNQRVVIPLVNAKFGKQLKYPKITVGGIVGRDMLSEAQVLVTLSGAGLIQVDDRVKDYVHTMFELPDYVTAVEQSLQPVIGSPMVPQGLPVTPIQPSIRPPGQTAPISQIPPMRNVTPQQPPPIVQQSYTRSNRLLSNYKGCSDPDCGVWTAQERQTAAAKYPTYKLINDASDSLANKLTAIQKERVTQLLAKIEKLIEVEGVSKGAQLAIKQYLSGDLALPKINDLKVVLSEFMGKLADDAVAQVYDEVGLPLKAISRRAKTSPASYVSNLDNDQTASIINQVGLMTQELDDAIHKAVFFALQTRSNATDSLSQILADITAAYEGVFKTKMPTLAESAVSTVINLMRNDVFVTPEVDALIEYYQFINPNPKTAICRSLAGRIFSKEEFALSPYLPPLHWHCNSFIAPITLSANKNSKYKLDPRGLTPSAIEGFTQEQVLNSAQWVG